MADIKISDSAFLSILRENGGLYAKTAAAIRDQFGIEYSRQAVRQRAADHKDEVEDINEEVQDNAEAGLQTLMKSTDEKIMLDAVKYYLNSKAKARGYTTRTELTGADGKDLNYTVTLDLGNTKNTINSIQGAEAGPTNP